MECKIFFSILARRLTSYMIKNHYINTSIQKGGIPGFFACIEHTSMITQLIQEAKHRKGDLTVVWLDLANAYGSVPHDLIQQGLDHYHIPAAIKDMITNYLRDDPLCKLRQRGTLAHILSGCKIALSQGR